MTIEQKAKAYDGDNEFNYVSDKYSLQRKTVEHIFPELKKSEDERIRNFISNELACLRAADEKGTVRYNELTEAIAWLEKQGEQEILCDKCRKEHPSHSCQDITELERCAVEHEQKHVDKVKSKFNVGEWITNGEFTWYIKKVGNDFYDLKSPDGRVSVNRVDTISHVDEHFHLWTIQDAKAGDVLFQDLMGGKTFIYNGINPDMAILYSFIINNDGEDVLPYHIGKPNTGIGNIEENKNIIHPATKEQRNLLFQKMKEAGYEWDSDTKELKKIEQKHTPKHKVGDTIYYNSFGELKSMIVANVTTDSTDNPIYEDENGSAVFEKDLVEQKSVDNIESSAFKDKLLKLFQRFRWYCKDEIPTNGDIIEYVDAHIQELIDTVQNKPWSEEDEEIIEALNDYVKNLDIFFSEIKIGDKDILSKEFREKVQLWLKSLKPQNRWKPSDGQIVTLRWVLNHMFYDSHHKEEISGLLEQLKKLREE